MDELSKGSLIKKHRILVVGDHESPLTWERGHVGLKEGYEIYWYYRSPLKRQCLEGIIGAFSPPTDLHPCLAMLMSPYYLLKVIRQIRPSLIHVFYAQQNFDALVLSHFSPLVVTVMGGDILPEQSYRGLWKKLTKKMLDASAIITTKSSFLDDAILRIGCYRKKLRRITWGIDTNIFSPHLDVGFLKRRWNISEKGTVFICPRLCRPFYNKHLVISAFALFLRSVHRANAVLLVSQLFADDAYSRKLIDLVGSLGIGHKVRFIGAIAHEDMPAYFALADIMVSFPSSDGMPQSLYEAMGCDVFPIMTDLPQYHELLRDGIDGRLVPSGDTIALSDAMRWAYEHTAERKGIVEKNRKLIFKIADKKLQDDLVNAIYDDLCFK